MVSFSEVAGDLNQIMGVKAVWGTSTEAVMCFGSHGDAKAKDKGHFSLARRTAEKAIAQPYLVTIGGGEQVEPEYDGRVLELIRITGVYGETIAFVQSDELKKRLEQWPVAVVCSETYAIEGGPHLIDDLGFSDRTILTNAFDGIRRNETQMDFLWDALKDWPVSRRWDVKPLPGFRDPGSVQLYGSRYPNVAASSSEGKRIWKRSRQIERNRELAKAAKEANREKNGGRIICEACGFSDESTKLFDAHHLQPLAAGLRKTRLDDLAVLCPTCHRWAHHKSNDILQPLSIEELRSVRSASNLT